MFFGNYNNNKNQPLMNMMQGSPNGVEYAASWALAASIVWLIFLALVFMFFYRILFPSGANRCYIPWRPFGIFLFIIVILFIILGIFGFVTSAILVSEVNDKKCKR